jgi:hypothetical protein
MKNMIMMQNCHGGLLSLRIMLCDAFVSMAGVFFISGFGALVCLLWVESGSTYICIGIVLTKQLN